MALDIGTNSYIDIVYADDYMINNYMSIDMELKKWDSLIDSDKEILLKRATVALDKIRWSGIKSNFENKLQFPRVVGIENGCYWDVGIPKEIKDACVEYAVSFLGCDMRRDLQSKGVSSVKIGSTNESYDLDKFNEIPDKVRSLIGKYIVNSFIRV